MNTAGRTPLHSWRALGVLALGALGIQWGCGPDRVDQTAPNVQAAIRALLSDVWPAVLAPTLTEAEDRAQTLVNATGAWSEAVTEGGSGTDERAEAMEAWLVAMDSWQVAELMQIGPGASSLTAIGGEDGRDEVYSWPTVNPCRVDQVTAGQEFTDTTFFEDSLVNVYGMDALETLLFSPAGENSCPAQVSINEDGTWEAMGPNGVARARAAYAEVLATRVESDIASITSGWADGFGDTLANAGEAGSPFETEVMGVNAVFDALFYLETETKDRKLGWPLGLNDCGQEDCSEQIELFQSGGSTTWIAANLAGFRRLFSGEEANGLDDLLRTLGQDEIAQEMAVALENAEAVAAEISVPVNEVDSADLDRLYSAIKEVTDILKRDVATVLSLQIPSEAAGDSD